MIFTAKNKQTHERKKGMEQKISMCRGNGLTLENAFEYFIRKCKVKNLTDSSIHSYYERIKYFYDFYGAKNRIEKISSDTVDNYILWLRQEHSANEISISSYIRSIRAFLYYCMNCGYIKQFKIPIPKVEKKIKETYSDDDLIVLLEEPKIEKCSFSEYKTWAFENYLIGTGNRISTALNIQIKDIDFENALITLKHTKNRRQQIIPLSNTLSDVLSRYLVYRSGTGEDYLFCNEYGNKASVRTYQQLVRRYNIKRNVNVTSAHSFRHTFAKNYILNNGDVFRLQKILGHSDITVTKEYVDMFTSDLSMDYEHFCPLDNLKKTDKKVKWKENK